MNELREQILSDLTDAQRVAVTHIDGPLLVLAGAGSGKTRVITRRVAWMMANGVNGGEILAVTFTNKAANEMKQRIELLAEQADRTGWGARPTVATFHSFAARMLRIHHEAAGLPADFSIYDQLDRTRAIKLAIARVGLSPDNFTPDIIEQVISREKNQLRTAADFAQRAAGFFDLRTADIFTAYEAVLAEAKALDFDDLLLRLALLLREEPFRQMLNERYRYVLIDEYQDTNTVQYQIARDLARPGNNICATGDPDQSIYGWRGADIDNILRFERDFAGTTVVRLEQNYRSTKRILAAADSLIRNNVRRKHKALWTDNPQGEKIALIRCADPDAEAELVADRIERAFAAGVGYSQMAVFMRLNALTRVLENAMLTRRIPYQIARGVSFYNRKEIKDATSYLRLIANPADRVALERVINTPPRGIGQTTVDRLIEFADAAGVDLWTAVRRAVGADTARAQLGMGSLESAEQPNFDASSFNIPHSQPQIPAPALGRSATAVKRFVELMDRLSGATREAASVQRAMELVLGASGLQQHYKDDENASANLGELITAAGQFDHATDFQATLNDWLQDIALISDTDSIDNGLGAVTMMTLHAAKGLEFPVVFIVGCEEGIIPLAREGRVADMEEERRLLFVGITRAMRQLTITHTAVRQLHGKTIDPTPSQFLCELGDDCVQAEDLAGTAEPPSYRSGWSPWRRNNAGQQARPADRFAGAADGPPRDREFSGADAEALRQAELESAQKRTGWPIGTLVRHAKFGIGKVVRVTPSGPYTKATVDFRTGGLKAVIMEMAPIERLLG